jgi:hypothetical protein
MYAFYFILVFATRKVRQLCQYFVQSLNLPTSVLLSVRLSIYLSPIFFTIFQPRVFKFWILIHCPGAVGLISD